MENLKEEMARLDHLILIVLKPGKDQLEFNPEKLGEILANIIERMQNIASMLLESGKLNEEDSLALESMKQKLSEAKGAEVHYDKAKPKREQEIVTDKPLMKIKDLEEFYKTLSNFQQPL